jgi:Predicted phosphoesterases, related to the Icc protein
MKIKRVSDKVVRSFRMRICHVSDTHGGFPRLHGRYDAVVHTGDFFPNSHHVFNRNKVQEAVFQMKWLEQNVDSLKQQLQGHPYLFVLGNHDFVNPQMVEMFLNAEGVKAFDLTDKIVTHEGVNFYGFPYVPEIGGDIWNYELDQFKMYDKVEELAAKLNLTYTDVLACHAPFYQCLDLSYGNQVLGNHHMANALTYKVSKDMTPSNYLCGHIHEANGVTYKNGMLVSNAATTYHIVEI